LTGYLTKLREVYYEENKLAVQEKMAAERVPKPTAPVDQLEEEAIRPGMGNHSFLDQQALGPELLPSNLAASPSPEEKSARLRKNRNAQSSAAGPLPNPVPPPAPEEK